MVICLKKSAGLNFNTRPKTLESITNIMSVEYDGWSLTVIPSSILFHWSPQDAENLGKRFHISVTPQGGGKKWKWQDEKTFPLGFPHMFCITNTDNERRHLAQAEKWWISLWLPSTLDILWLPEEHYWTMAEKTGSACGFTTFFGLLYFIV